MSDALTLKEIFAAQDFVAWEGKPLELRTRIPSLYLRVSRRGCRWFLLRRKPSGSRKRIQLGRWPEVMPEQVGDLARLAKRDFARAHHKPKPPVTVGQLLGRYGTMKLKAMRRGDVTLRALETVLEPVADRDPLSLAHADIQALLTPLAIRAAINANRTRGYLSAFFEWAIKRGAVDVNPVRGLEPFVAEARRDRLLSLGEVGEIWNSALSLGYPFGPAVQLLILTGALREEVSLMHWSDLTRDEHARSLIWTIRPLQTDERQHHAVPLSRSAADILSAVALSTDRTDDFVFSTTGATSVSGWGRAKRRLDAGINGFRAVRGRAPMPAWRLNDLRAAFAYHGSETIGEQAFYVDRCLGRVRGLNSMRGRMLASDDNAMTWKLQTFEAWSDCVAKAAYVEERPIRKMV